MANKRYRPEEIITKLREADILISQGNLTKRTEDNAYGGVALIKQEVLTNSTLGVITA
jgi:hypothetical protein